MNKNIFILGIFSIAILILALAIRPDVQQSISNEPTYDALAPGLKDSLNDIDRIIIESATDVVTIAKDGKNVWNVKELYNYPASTAQIRKTLLYLSQSELRAKKSNDPKKLQTLGLGDDNLSTLKLFSNDELAHEITLGKPARDGMSTYVRTGTPTQSYVATGRLEFKANPHDWLFYDLFSVNRKRVQNIKFHFVGQKPYRYERARPDETLELKPLPENKQRKQQRMPLDPSYYFERMVFTDVLPQSRITQSTPNIVTMHTFDGLILTLQFHTIKDEEWVHISAQASREHYTQSIEDMQSFDTTRQEAEAINTRVSDWIYKLGQFQYNQLKTSYFDLVEDKSPEAVTHEDNATQNIQP